jgi:hypothetical protein
MKIKSKFHGYPPMIVYENGCRAQFFRDGSIYFEIPGGDVTYEQRAGWSAHGKMVYPTRLTAIVAARLG